MAARERLPRWLLLIHQLPSEPSSVRVKIWRRLQGVGAVLAKNSVYVLPNKAETREHFEWIRTEIVAHGGEVAVFAADAVDDLTTTELIEAMVGPRRSDWQELRDRARALQTEYAAAVSDHEARERRDRELDAIRGRVARLDRIDYLQAPGRQEALDAIEAAASAIRPLPAEEPPEPADVVPAEYLGRRWLTRPRPGVDRMASAWLIRRFIDPDAEFDFADRIAPESVAANRTSEATAPVPFDMYGVEFGHHGEHCTFETLMARFGLTEPSLRRIARIVHGLDLQSESPADPESLTIGRLVDGLRLSETDDGLLLERGIAMFEALYSSFRGEARA